MTDPSDDPVLVRRRQMAKLSSLGQRLGYVLFGIATVVFFIGLARGFDDSTVNVVTTCLIVGSVLLAPAIVVSHAVRAADREDREQGR